MEDDQELRFVCKLCNKKYPCGKSLGGHMRSHVVFANSVESDENFEKRVSSICVSEHQISVKDSKSGEFGNGHTSYGLRENPRKTWRAVDSNSNSNPPLQLERFCKQCGKGFQSLKALCGHMACHSDRDKGLKDDHSWTSEKMVIDSHSDTEEEGDDDRVMRTRSSKAKRYKKIGLNSTFDCLAYNIGDSSVSEIDVFDEQEEVAMCLMLLSRDSGNKGGVNSVVESSDNNSVVLETKSFSIDMRNIGKKEEEEKKIRDMKLKSSAFDAEIAHAENSDSEYFLDECAKPGSDVSIDGFRRNARLGDYSEQIKSLNKGKSYRTELNREFNKENEYDDHRSQKRSKYECFNCKKTFKSYQALGGHRPCHKRSNAYYESRYESGDESTDFKLVEHTRNKKSISEKKIKSKKSKGHVCPFCNRVFKNGQALGGHKRSHFIGGHEGNRNQSPVIKPDLLDLNLPAPEEDDVDVHDGRFFPW